MSEDRPRKHRTSDEAHKALSGFCKAVGTHGDHSIHVFSIPVDNDRDLDCILSDVIEERDRLRAAVQKVLADEETGKGWGPDRTMADVLATALFG